MGINLGKGTYLIANPDGLDQNFTKTVVLICDHHRDRGTFGLIVNRGVRYYHIRGASRISQCGGSCKKIFFGGPVETGKLFCLHASHKRRHIRAQ